MEIIANIGHIILCMLLVLNQGLVLMNCHNGMEMNYKSLTKRGDNSTERIYACGMSPVL